MFASLGHSQQNQTDSPEIPSDFAWQKADDRRGAGERVSRQERLTIPGTRADPKPAGYRMLLVENDEALARVRTFANGWEAYVGRH